MEDERPITSFPRQRISHRRSPSQTRVPRCCRDSAASTRGSDAGPAVQKAISWRQPCGPNRAPPLSEVRRSTFPETVLLSEAAGLSKANGLRAVTALALAHPRRQQSAAPASELPANLEGVTQVRQGRTKARASEMPALHGPSLRAPRRESLAAIVRSVVLRKALPARAHSISSKGETSLGASVHPAARRSQRKTVSLAHDLACFPQRCCLAHFRRLGLRCCQERASGHRHRRSAGAGKSTLAAHLARRFGLLNLETGAMYRALALKAIENDIDFDDEAPLLRLANETSIHLEPTRDGNRVLLDKLGREPPSPGAGRHRCCLARFHSSGCSGLDGRAPTCSRADGRHCDGR